MDRKLDTSTGAGGATTVARTRFDSHLNDCRECQPHMCRAAQQLWRQVCLAALKQRHADGSVPASGVLAAEMRLTSGTLTAVLPLIGRGQQDFATSAADADWSGDHPSTQDGAL